MGRSQSRSPRLSLSRSAARVRVHSPSLRRKSPSNCFENEQEVEFLGSNEAENIINNEGGTEFRGGNKVMVVIDSSLEAKGALEWALSHTIQGQDTIILLHVAKPRKRESSNKKRNPASVYELLQSMKNMCQKKRPGVQVEVAKLEGKEKGPIIVEAAKQQKVSLLVLGQRKKSMIWRLMRRWTGKSGRRGVVDYCIQNASCMTIAVRRKNNELGGYLITTKCHKNFWLLA
ncbi:hypothetical protein REPUB_Repub08aG0054300 [Reevesia pubescens]